MKTTRFIFGALVVVLLAAAFAPLPAGANSLASDSLILNNPTQAFMEAALGLPLLSPMTMSASAPIVRVAVDNTASLATPNYACKLTAQTPANWIKVSGRYDFDAKWTLQNVGLKTWYKVNTDYKYLSVASSGVPKIMHKWDERYDLPWNVAPTKKITLTVDMLTPKYTGQATWYTETWGLINGSSVFCRFSVTLWVVR
jgi:hypothetical protein